METPYERKPNESAKAFEAFQLYADKGADRSLAAVGQALGKSGSLIERWSRLYHWVERAWAYDVHMARAKHEAEEAALREESAEWKRREKEHKENLWRVSKACLHAGEEALKRFYENARKGATLGDVSHIFDVGAKLGGLATGTATERTEVTGLNGGPIQVDLLPALRKVFGQIVDARDGLGARPPGDDRQILLIPRGDGLEPPVAALPESHHQPHQPHHTMNDQELYFEAGRQLGCTWDQMGLFTQAGVILQPRQLLASAAARLCDKPDGPTAIGYGGARGGGKSHWLLAQMGVDDCQRVPGLKCLLLRKVGKANMENFEDLRRRLFGRLPHEFSAYRGLLTFGNGSRIVAGHYQAEKDIDNYLGLEYDVIGIEEATTLSHRKHQDITTCCRTSKQNWRPRIYSTTNPGGVGHAWYRAKFIVPYCESRETETRFIPARVTDNNYCNAEYVKVLQNLSGWQKRAWFDGDWDIAAGQYFTPWRREVHVIDDFDDTRGREWFAALDYGFTHYTVVLLGCRDGDGNVFVVDEHAQRKWLPDRHAAAVKAMLARHQVGAYADLRAVPRFTFHPVNKPELRPLAVSDLRRFVAGADVFSRQSDGTTVAAQYARLGINLRPANMDRVNGWAEILQRLGDMDAGIRPTLFIHRRCGRLIETLPSLQHDPNRPEDVLKVDADEDGIGGDDAADTLRYLLATKAREIRVTKLRGL